MVKGFDIDMTYFICPDCGGFHGYPSKYKGSECPYCMKRTKSNLAAIVYEKDNEIEKLIHSNNGLRGTITRLKKGRS